jgi:hypothetical protein
MTKQIICIAVICWTALVPSSLFSFEWPVEDTTILSTFGENDEGVYKTAVQVGVGRQPVQAVLDGEVLYYNAGRVERWGPQSGLGNYVVLAHPGGLRSVYSHLDQPFRARGRFSITQGETIGSTGESGYSRMTNVGLSIIDVENGQYINPLILLPPVNDVTSPIIQNLYMFEDETMEQIGEVTIVEPGEIRLVMKAYDLGEVVRFFNPMNVFQILVYVNGVEKTAVNFEGIMEQQGGLVLTGGGNYSVNDLFAERFLFELGTFTMQPGESRMEIIVKDYIGNETNKLLRFIVQN